MRTQSIIARGAAVLLLALGTGLSAAQSGPSNGGSPPQLQIQIDRDRAAQTREQDEQARQDAAERLEARRRAIQERAEQRPDNVFELMQDDEADWDEDEWFNDRPEPGGPLPEGEDEDTVSFAAFSEPIELTTLVEYIGSTLNINIVIRGELTGSIVFNAPVEIPRTQLLELLDALLEQWDFTITREDLGFYLVQEAGAVRPSLVGDDATTRIVPTPNVRPSVIQTAVTTAIQGTGQAQITFFDELGVVVITASPRQIRRIQSVIEEIVAEYNRMRYTRIELRYLAAPVARERALDLVSTTPRRPTAMPGFGQPDPGQTTPDGVDNLSQRLRVDQQGNALLFRGYPQEIEQVRTIIELIDAANTLEPREYFAGSAAIQIADIASQRGLGEVVMIGDQDPFARQTTQQPGFGQFPGFQAQQQGRTFAGGPVMVVDVLRGSILYYGTPPQQEELAALMRVLRTEDERIVIREYKLNHADAELVAEIIQGILTGQARTGDSPLLPGTAAGRQQIGAGQQRPIPVQPGTNGADGEVGFTFDPDKVFVIADIANNQVVVKAPIKQQDDFAKLIGRLDLRRPQVYIEATIVSISDTSEFRLAIESQLRAGQFRAGTNFGLSQIGQDAVFGDRRVVNPGLPGFTSALIRSTQVPFILNAIQEDGESRILSVPQLLVNDNEEALIVSLDQQPTTETVLGQVSEQTTFRGYEDAGTSLEVTPSISEAGFLRLLYRIELSNFIGTGSNGIPPPRQERTVEGQVTIPSDSTIVVGGIRVEDVQNTVVKVPLLGDIPLLGHAFRDTRRQTSSSTLYVFITPRIMTDPNFSDLKLLTRGPQSEVGIDADTPDLEPAIIEIVSARTLPRRRPLPEPHGDPVRREDLLDPSPRLEPADDDE